MTKEELEQEAEMFVSEKADKGNFDIEQFGRAYFSESSMKQALVNFAKAETALLSQHILDLQKDKGNLTDEVRKLKILVSSLFYEINQIWDINEMNDDLRISAEKIDREVQLSKMAEDNRMVISALGFAVVPPKPKVDVKEV